MTTCKLRIVLHAFAPWPGLRVTRDSQCMIEGGILLCWECLRKSLRRGFEPVGTTTSKSELTRDEVLETLRGHKRVLKERFGVEGLRLVGSLARGENGVGRDIDLIVDFNGPATAVGFFGTHDYLESIFDCEVDLMTEKGLREGMQPFIERHAISV